MSSNQIIEPKAIMAPSNEDKDLKKRVINQETLIPIGLFASILFGVVWGTNLLNGMTYEITALKDKVQSLRQEVADLRGNNSSDRWDLQQMRLWVLELKSLNHDIPGFKVPEVK